MKHAAIDPPVAFSEFLRNVGVTPCTGWRWRQKKLIETINILGRQYVSRSEIQRFNERAAKGEFAKVPTPPHPPKAKRRQAA